MTEQFDCQSCCCLDAKQQWQDGMAAHNAQADTVHSKVRSARISLPVAMAQGAASVPAPREHLAISVNGQGTPAASDLQGYRAGLVHGPRLVRASAGRHISISSADSWESISTCTASPPEGPCQTPVP